MEKVLHVISLCNQVHDLMRDSSWLVKIVLYQFSRIENENRDKIKKERIMRKKIKIIDRYFKI